MHERRTVEAALELAASGLRPSDVARRLRVPRSTVRGWLAGDLPRYPHDPPGECRAGHDLVSGTPSYVYLLGLYLGDGWLSAPKDRVAKLRIAFDVRYPGIIAAARQAIGDVCGRVGGRLNRPRHCVEVYSYWKHWLCLLPQHGPGKKHERVIRLADWQADAADVWPPANLGDGYRYSAVLTDRDDYHSNAA